jgi:hypothetical protein
MACCREVISELMKSLLSMRVFKSQMCSEIQENRFLVQQLALQTLAKVKVHGSPAYRDLPKAVDISYCRMLEGLQVSATTWEAPSSILAGNRTS